MKTASAYRIPPLSKADKTRKRSNTRQAEIIKLSQIRYNHAMAKYIEVEDEHLTRADRAEIAKFNRDMEKVGLVLIPIAFLLGAICFVVNLGRAVGWWA
jgi:hypothetical protein